jgi:uncharacterized protein
MPRVSSLPHPPAVPPVSPAVAVEGERETLIPGEGGGPRLEARQCAPSGALRVVVICHPHPLYGGSMHSPVPLAIAKCLADHAGGTTGAPPRVAWVRFNFRGVGSSEGRYDDGRGEVDDVLAAIGQARRVAPGAAVSLCGHSFGSFVGFRAATRDGNVERLLLLAPSTRFFAFDAPAHPFRGRATVFVGDKDDLCDVDEAASFARAIGADLKVFQGFDHHFMKSRRAMAEAALPVIAPEASPDD